MMNKNGLNNSRLIEDNWLMSSCERIEEALHALSLYEYLTARNAKIKLTMTMILESSEEN